MTRTCRMELCRYWPGEGCMAGVMPCDADVPGECPECGGTGTVEAPRCTCGGYPSGDHDEDCGLESCPQACQSATALTAGCTLAPGRSRP